MRSARRNHNRRPGQAPIPPPHEPAVNPTPEIREPNRRDFVAPFVVNLCRTRRFNGSMCEVRFEENSYPSLSPNSRCWGRGWALGGVEGVLQLFCTPNSGDMGEAA